MTQQVQKDLDRVNTILQPGVRSVLTGGQTGLFFYYYDLYKATGDQALEALDRQLFDTGLRQIEAGNMSWLRGAAGIVYYFSECKETDLTRYYLDELVAGICHKAIQDEDGCRFEGPCAGAAAGDTIDFSLPHGLCGILLVLINACKRTRHRSLIETIVKGGTRFILRHKMDVDYANGDYSFFPVIVKRQSDEIRSSNQLAWCQGDLNEVLLFYRAGALLKDAGLLQLADLIGAQSMMRKDEKSTRVTTAGFYDGAAGLAQYYKTLHKESHLSSYLDGYTYWIEQAMLLLDKNPEQVIYPGEGCPEGLAGIALTLASYVSGIEPEWSRLMLL